MLPRKFVQWTKSGPKCLKTGLANGCTSEQCRHCQELEKYLDQPGKDADGDDRDDGDNDDNCVEEILTRVEMENKVLEEISRGGLRMERTKQGSERLQPCSQRTIPYEAVLGYGEDIHWQCRDEDENKDFLAERNSVLYAKSLRAAPFFEKPPSGSLALRVALSVSDRRCVELRPAVPQNGVLRVCPFCSKQWRTDSEAIVFDTEASLYTMNGCMSVKVYSRLCESGHSLPYDGLEDALFRADHQTLYTYELMADMYNFQRGKAQSFKAYWEANRDRFIQAGYASFYLFAVQAVFDVDSVEHFIKPERQADKILVLLTWRLWRCYGLTMTTRLLYSAVPSASNSMTKSNHCGLFWMASQLVFDTLQPKGIRCSAQQNIPSSAKSTPRVQFYV